MGVFFPPLSHHPSLHEHTVTHCSLSHFGEGVTQEENEHKEKDGDKRWGETVLDGSWPSRGIKKWTTFHEFFFSYICFLSLLSVDHTLCSVVAYLYHKQLWNDCLCWWMIFGLSVITVAKLLSQYYVQQDNAIPYDAFDILSRQRGISKTQSLWIHSAVWPTLN